MFMRKYRNNNRNDNNDIGDNDKNKIEQLMAV